MDSALVRAVVYATGGEFTVLGLLERLHDEHGLRTATQELERTAARLKLRFVVGRNPAQYFYRATFYRRIPSQRAPKEAPAMEIAEKGNENTSARAEEHVLSGQSAVRDIDSTEVANGVF